MGEQKRTKNLLDECLGGAASRRLAALPLRGVVQHYAWGKCAQTSLVAAMAEEQCRSERDVWRAPPLSRGLRFAELWMGTHPSGPSSVRVSLVDEDGEESPGEVFLKDLLVSDPEHWLGPEDGDRGNLPFLFKVLSVRQALSIQAHPDKMLAEQLHREFPAHYPDENHKPEICLPLGHFEALVGFRPAAEVRAYVRSVPELRDLCAPGGTDVGAATIRELYARLMRSDQFSVIDAVRRLVERVGESAEPTPEEALAVKLERDQPGDVGIFSVFFLNHVRITEDMPHRFIFCAANEPHAYLEGDCVECMALSDNVVRAGLTPKFKDIETLLGMLTYRDDILGELVNEGKRVAPGVVKFAPPVDDFAVFELDGPTGGEGLCLPRAAICACVLGEVEVEFTAADGAEAEGMDLTLGHTIFCRANTRVRVTAASPDAKLFIATYETWPATDGPAARAG